MLNCFALENGGRREGRVLAHTHGPPAEQKAGGSHHRYEPNIRPSLRDWFYGLYVISPGTGFLAPVIGVMPSHREAMSRSIVANLAPAPERQDHTTSPSMPACIRRCSLHVHRSPHSTYRDDAYAPLRRGGITQEKHDFWKNEIEIFFTGGLDTGAPIENARELRGLAHGFFGPHVCRRTIWTDLTSRKS
jgi:hypothetical protein